MLFICLSTSFSHIFTYFYMVHLWNAQMVPIWKAASGQRWMAWRLHEGRSRWRIHRQFFFLFLVLRISMILRDPQISIDIPQLHPVATAPTTWSSAIHHDTGDFFHQPAGKVRQARVEKLTRKFELEKWGAQLTLWKAQQNMYHLRLWQTWCLLFCRNDVFFFL